MCGSEAGVWMPLPTRPQRYCDPASLVSFSTRHYLFLYLLDLPTHLEPPFPHSQQSYHMKFGALGFCNKQKVFLFEEEEGGNPAKRKFKSQGILSSFAELGGKDFLMMNWSDH